MYDVIAIAVMFIIGFIFGCWIMSNEMRDELDKEIAAHKKTKQLSDELDEGRRKLISELTIRNKELEKELISRQNQSL